MLKLLNFNVVRGCGEEADCSHDETQKTRACEAVNTRKMLPRARKQPKN